MLYYILGAVHNFRGLPTHLDTICSVIRYKSEFFTQVVHCMSSKIAVDQL